MSERRARRFLAVVVFIAVLAMIAGASPASATTKPSSTKKPPPAPSVPSALIVYDSTSEFGWLGQLYAQQTANLVGHFGTFKATRATAYVPGDIEHYTATIYIGSTYNEPLPDAFLNDVRATTHPVIWIYDNIWLLAGGQPGHADPAFATAYGWVPEFFDSATVGEVRYKNTGLTRYMGSGTMPILTTRVTDGTKATVLADAVRQADGSTEPWAIRSRNLTYIADNPFAFATENDRYLAFSDLLFDALAPATPERHRALVRLEDVNPSDDPVYLRNAVDYLASQHIPFSFGVFPVYTDPTGYYNNGVPETIRLVDSRGMVAAIKYAIAHGGTMIMHGYTHQYDKINNPYSGVSGDDFEFYAAHVDALDNVVLDGPLAVDSTGWFLRRVKLSGDAFVEAGLPVPGIFEFPHYAGTALDYSLVSKPRYERALYPGGLLEGGVAGADYAHQSGQFFPYVVKDIYGAKVIPENLGNYEPVAYNNHPTRFPADIALAARRNLVVRDGFASFFYHPYLGVDALRETVEGVRAAGYTFVSANSVL